MLNHTPLAARKHAAFILAADADFFDELITTSLTATDVHDVPGVHRAQEEDWLLPIQSHLVIRERATLETNPHYRQIVPYVVLRMKRENDVPLYFHYQRMKGVGESRLAGNHSIGIGGHIESEDLVFVSGSEGFEAIKGALHLRQTIHDSMARELLEEFGIKADFVNSPFDVVTDAVGNHFALLIDSANEVGRVHAGFVYIVDVTAEHQPVESKEAELEARGFDTAQNLLNNTTMENWSRMLLEYLVSYDRPDHHSV